MLDLRASLLPSFLLALLTACSCGDDPDIGSCETSADCTGTRICIDGRCMSGSDVDGGPGGDAPALMCEDGRDPCGLGSLAACCGAEQVCLANRCQEDCGDRVRCDGLCCESGQECVEGACVVECADEAQRCGAAGELCCADGEACISDACVELGDECEATEECPLDFLCDPVIGRCIPRDAVEVCEFRPPPGEFTPAVACRWLPVAGDRVNFDEVVMTPSVANLTDDNGDGRTDTNDIPDIVFVSFNRQDDGCCTERGAIRVVSGLCNDDGTESTPATMNTLATLDEPFIDNSTGIALGNLHPDTMDAEHPPEIVAVTRTGGGNGDVLAYRRTADDGSAWEILWRAVGAMNGRWNGSGAAPSIADLDADGQPEVIVGNLVLNGLTGAVVWDGFDTVGASAGIGNNAFLGPTSTVADLDLDGTPEVIAGNTVYDGPTGAEVWTYEFTTNNSACGGSIRCDGYNAVGNFDADMEGEVVIVRRGEVFVLEHDGALKRRVVIPRDDCGNNESGPPTVADFDGDGRAEIGTASADFYVVVDLDCTGDPLPAECAEENVLWRVPNRDCSSRSTGSSVFDFDGDGNAEVVYADEQDFYILDGRNGDILFQDTQHESNTRLEMPIVVDVDNDGKSEVLVPEAPRDEGAGVREGLLVWADADNNWVRTRRIWNQHSYHVTNVTEDGQIPRSEEPNWTNGRLNNFRQNVQPGGLFDAPDLFIVEIDVVECDPGGTVTIGVTVGNRGALGVAAGVPVTASATPEGGDPVSLGVERTATFLLPGQQETVRFTWTPEGGFTFRNFTVSATVDDDGMGGSEYNECDEENNGGMSEVLMTCDLG